MKIDGFDGTPHTVVVSRDGKVVQSWPGAYVGKSEQDVAAYFRMQFTHPSVGKESLPGTK